MHIQRIILIRDKRHAGCFRLLVNGIECAIFVSRESAADCLEAL